MDFLFLFAVIVACFGCNDGARILGVFPVPSISHQIVFRALMEELSKRGHELVVVTPDPVKYNETEFPNFRQIDIHEISYKIFKEGFNFVDARLLSNDPLELFNIFFPIALNIVDAELSVPEVKELIQNPKEHFDLCIVEGIYPSLYAFKERFKTPLIIINSFVGFLQNLDAFGVPTHPILYPDVFSQYHHKDLNLWEKTVLIYRAFYYRYLYYWKFVPMYNEAVRKHFGPDIPSVDVMENSADILFQNYHPEIVGIRPLVPGVVPLGSMHIKPPKPLPPNLQKLLDESTEGVVYFSLGSNVRSSGLPGHVVKAFLDALRKLPYKVLWKWETESLPDKPDNVIISKWFPQQDILAHPNIKAFITQGGQQSMEEAIHHKVPLIGMPFLGDQEFNVGKMVSNGIGKMINIDTITEDKLRDTIIEIVENPSYRENITKLRDLIYDKPQSSVERAVWWTEYVLRHGGARHLRSPAADTTVFHYFMLDLLATYLAILAALLLILRFVYRLFIPAQSKTKLKSS